MNRNKRVVLIGGRTKASSLAMSLIKQGYKCTAINSNYEECLRLADIKGLNVIHGDGTKPYILEDADIEGADIAIALTSKDADNLVACQLCKNKYGVSKAVAIVSDPEKTDFFYQKGVDSVVCAVSAVTAIIEKQAIIDEITNIVPIGHGRVQIVEVQIKSDSPASGKKLWEIELPKESIVGCILRSDTTLIPRGDTRIHTGDTLVVLTGNGQELNTVYALTGR